ncbi:HEAT repeat domain-containing protein [Spirulina subsalsa FACHB-351]|uniref:HEAT repeat domain-containing protein n=1 Tax=Spirulina subsalsa FACHB-351 TaxID=234711 RepID=A0ABT3L795_9CYAN|nr:HEAT repeat domain-containing protein [Spirulina subsalsa]MCW6037365.1 HEAT repeat domain-containing protein [Spirulina subsalsa FACHB-351]
MSKLSHKAQVASAQGDLKSAIYYVQQFLLEEQDQPLPRDNSSEKQQVLEVLLEILDQGDFHSRWDVVKLLPHWGVEALPSLMAILESDPEDPEKQWFVTRILGSFPHPPVIQSLIHCLHHSPHEDVVSSAAAALATMGEAAVVALGELLEEPESRLLAVRSLAQIRCPAVIEPLLGAVKDDDWQVRAIALEALASFHQEPILEQLILSLDDLAAPVRKEAVIGLGMQAHVFPEYNLLPYLQPRLYDFNLSVCQQAAIAISRLGSNEAAQTLLNVLQSAATPIRLKIDLIRALAWMETPYSLDCLRFVLNNQPEATTREIIAVLGRVESLTLRPIAAQILLDFAQTQPLYLTPEIKQALAVAWGQLQDSCALDYLSQMQEDAEPKVKLHAIAALKKLHSTQPKVSRGRLLYPKG